jgi:SAM-dependent methyltransferase
VTEHNGLYGRSHYYDIACSRDVRPELDFLRELFRRQIGRLPTSMVDIACGPGYHARAFAAVGLRAVGMDVQPEMIAYAAGQKDASSVQWLVGDMRDFQLDTPVDLAFCCNSGIDYLLTNAELVNHLRTVARNLEDDGLYVIELCHPRDSHPYDYGNWRYVGERDGTRVTIDWGTNRPLADPISHVARVEVTTRVQQNGTETLYTDSALERYISGQEIALLCDLSGAFKVVDWYGAFDFRQPLDNSQSATSVIAVLARSGA